MWLGGGGGGGVGGHVTTSVIARTASASTASPIASFALILASHHGLWGLIRRAGQPRHCVTRASWHSTTTSWWAWHVMKQSRKREEPGVGASTTPKEVSIHHLLIHILTTLHNPPEPSPGPQERVEAHVKRHRPNKGTQPKNPRAQFN